MKLLFGQNLSPRLVRLLADLFPGKDGDFQVRSVLLGHPPKVTWLRVGNAGTPEIAGLPRGASAELLMFDGDGEAALLTVGLLGSE